MVIVVLEFDEQKRALTLENRGLDFGHADQVFRGPTFTLVGEREERGEARRIISMRECHAKERKRYEEHLDRSG